MIWNPLTLYCICHIRCGVEHPPNFTVLGKTFCQPRGTHKQCVLGVLRSTSWTHGEIRSRGRAKNHNTSMKRKQILHEKPEKWKTKGGACLEVNCKPMAELPHWVHTGWVEDGWDIDLPSAHPLSQQSPEKDPALTWRPQETGLGPANGATPLA